MPTLRQRYIPAYDRKFTLTENQLFSHHTIRTFQNATQIRKVFLNASKDKNKNIANETEYET